MQPERSLSANLAASITDLPHLLTESSCPRASCPSRWGPQEVRGWGRGWLRKREPTPLPSGERGSDGENRGRAAPSTKHGRGSFWCHWRELGAETTASQLREGSGVEAEDLGPVSGNGVLKGGGHEGPRWRPQLAIHQTPAVGPTPGFPPPGLAGETRK